MIPQHWPSFWLGLLSWPFITIALLFVIFMLYELSDALNALEWRIRQRLAAKRTRS